MKSQAENAENKRPKIGISGTHGGKTSSIAAIVSQIQAMGGEPCFIGDHGERALKEGSTVAAVNKDLAGLDGLIVMGNSEDIDPAKYGARRHPATKVETDTARADYEETALQKAMDMGMPVLAICGGMQRLNIVGGGTLHQHVPDIVGDNHHVQTDLPFVPVQAVVIAKDSKLGAIAGKTHSLYTPAHQELPASLVLENSFHHQAVDKIRDDFRPSALSDDGIIEAIEPKPGSRYANQYVIAVQWHPEFGASELGPKIANSVIDAAHAYAKQKAQPQTELKPTPELKREWAARLLARQQNAVLMR